MTYKYRIRKAVRDRKIFLRQSKGPFANWKIKGFKSRKEMYEWYWGKIAAAIANGVTVDYSSKVYINKGLAYGRKWRKRAGRPQGIQKKKRNKNWNKNLK